MRGSNITIKELSKRFDEVEKSNGEMAERLRRLERSDSELKEKLGAIETASSHYVGLAEKYTVLAKAVNKIRQERDVWKDRIIWLIVLLLVTTAYNYIPKLLAPPQKQAQPAQTISVDQLSEIIEQINMKGGKK